jgi:hypothetical protein
VVTSIAVPAQVDASGQFEFGVSDVVAGEGDVFVGVKGHTAGYIHVRYLGEHTDDLPVAAHTLEPVAPVRVLGNQSLTNPTDVAFTVYIPG